jgi:hypothetical protein
MKNSFFSRFTPQEPKFFPMLKRLSEILTSSSDLLVESMQHDKPEEREDYYKRIKDMEREGDKQTHLIFDELAKPPISVCEEVEGIPFHHVNRFQTIAAITPERIIGKEIYCSTTVLDTVLAIPNPPIIHLAIKNATKLKNAAHITAWNGVRTLVDTMVAIELAAS